MKFDPTIFISTLLFLNIGFYLEIFKILIPLQNRLPDCINFHIDSAYVC